MKEFDKGIVKDWLEAYPELSLCNKNKLIKVLGSLLVGIELVKLPKLNEYRPHFVVYSLWGGKNGSSLKDCLEGPVLMFEFNLKNGLQVNIPLSNHREFFLKNLNVVQEQLPFALHGDVKLKKIWSAFELYNKQPPLKNSEGSYLNASYDECKLEFALSIDDEKEAKKILSSIKTKKWDLNHFSMFGVKYDKWIKNLEDKIERKGSLQKKIEINKGEKEIENLFKSRIIL